MVHSINLISDTVTLPTKAMRNSISQAPLGDDVFRTDPSINSLESFAAEMFEMEAGLFCPSGTMTNQIAIHLHTRALDEILCDKTAHIYNYEGGAWAMHSSVSIQLLDGKDGILTADMIKEGIQPDFDWLPRTRLVSLENTGNKAGGTYYTIDDIDPIRQVCKDNQLKLHLDGARLFNALVETGESASDYGKRFDTISICLSKGLGAPVGSLLLGNSEDIQRARKIRKALGGGMRQAGMLAAAGEYALRHHIPMLKEDHQKAQMLKSALASCAAVDHIKPVKTNIVIFDLGPAYGNADQFVRDLKDRGILCSAFGPKTIRMVTHMDVSMDKIKHTCEVIRRL